MRVADVMQRGVVTVSPDVPISELEELLAVEDISGAPVVDALGKPVGIVTKTDVVRALAEERGGLGPLLEEFTPDLRVEDIMTRELVTATPDEDVRSVARKMLDGGVHRVLVVDGDKIVGILSAFDLLRVIAELPDGVV